MNDTLYTIELSNEEKELVCSIINKFGSGQHPVADSNTYNGFRISYLKTILNSKKFKTNEINLTESGKKILEQIHTKL